MPDLLHWVRPQCVASPWLLLVIICHQAWISWSYFSIPRSLDRIMRLSGGPPIVTGGAVRGAAAFIGSCGIYHLFSIFVLFAPGLDWPLAFWGLWTSAISWWTARRLSSRVAMIAQVIRDARALDRVVSP